MLIEIDANKSIQCATCGEIHPATGTYFVRADNKTLHDRCMACYDDFLGRERRVFDKYKSRPGYKWCKKCNTEYPATATYWYSHTAGDRDRFSSPCRKCTREYAIGYREQSKTHRRDKTDEEKARLVARQAEKMQRKYSLPLDFTDNDWQFCLDYFGGRCAACKSPQTADSPLHQDHWIALYWDDCPGTIPSNIVPLCEHCNSRKSTRDADDWLEFEFGKEAAQQRSAEIEMFFSLVRTERSTEPARPRGRPRKSTNLP